MILYVSLLIIVLCQAHHHEHRRGSITERTNNEGPPPKCSKSFCEQMRLNGTEHPPKNTTWDPNPDSPKNCTALKLIESRRDVKVGRTIEDVIVYVIRFEKIYCELSPNFITAYSDVIKPNCNLIRIDFSLDQHCKNLWFKDHLITVNQAGVLIDDDILRDDNLVSDGRTAKYHWEAFSQLSCLSCRIPDSQSIWITHELRFLY